MAIAEDLNRLQQAVRLTAEGCGRDPETIRIVAVSKTFPAGVVEAAVDAGQLIFGENRVQEAQLKIPAVSRAGLEWHFIGHLQSNKSHAAAKLFDVVQTLDREKIVRRLGLHCREAGKVLRVLIEVNVGGETQKSGAPPSLLQRLVATVDEESHLQLVGLMAIPPYQEDAERSRPYFRQLASQLASLNRNREDPLSELSMGMSGDYRVAIEEGATLIRVGTAIFGSRG